MQTEKANLKFQQDGSDKVYVIALQQCETGWSVYAQWGRRGSTLQSDYKIERAEYDAAKKVYDRVLREKLAKGYRHSEGRTATDTEGDSRNPATSAFTTNKPVSRAIIFAPELLTRIEERDLHLKAKYEITGSFVVGQKPKDDGKRSIALYIYDRGRLRRVANARVFDKYPIPPIGAVVDARYLYAYKGGGIVQPWYDGVVRKDVKPEECTDQQLKYKAELEEAA